MCWFILSSSSRNCDFCKTIASHKFKVCLNGDEKVACNRVPAAQFACLTGAMRWFAWNCIPANKWLIPLSVAQLFTLFQLTVFALILWNFLRSIEASERFFVRNEQIKHFAVYCHEMEPFIMHFCSAVFARHLIKHVSWRSSSKFCRI